MARRELYKFDASSRIAVIELASIGYTYVEIADRLGISRSTLDRWRARDAKFEESIQKARSNGLSNCIEIGLRRLAQGAKREEISEEWLENREDTKGESRVVKVKRKVIEHAPDSKAITILARQHAKHYAEESDTEAVSSVLNVNLEGLTLRELQQELADSPIERQEPNDNGTLRDTLELEASDYSRLGAEGSVE